MCSLWYFFTNSWCEDSQAAYSIISHLQQEKEEHNYNMSKKSRLNLNIFKNKQETVQDEHKACKN